MDDMKVWSSRYRGTYGVNWSGKGPKPAAAYRGARRNAGRNFYNTKLRETRKALGMTRREFDTFWQGGKAKAGLDAFLARAKRYAAL